MAEAAVALASPTTWQDDCLALAEAAWRFGLEDEAARLHIELQIGDWTTVHQRTMEVARCALMVARVARTQDAPALRASALALNERALAVAERVVREAPCGR